MADIESIWSNEKGFADWSVSAGDLKADNDLKTSVLNALFTDRRANADDVLPDENELSDRRGWWADSLNQNERLTGSRLWLLARSKSQQEVVLRAKEYVNEALQYLIDDGVAQEINTTTAIVNRSVLSIKVLIKKPDGQTYKFEYEYAWQMGNLEKVITPNFEL